MEPIKITANVICVLGFLLYAPMIIALPVTAIVIIGGLTD